MSSSTSSHLRQQQQQQLGCWRVGAGLDDDGGDCDDGDDDCVGGSAAVAFGHLLREASKLVSSQR
eukprot:CAMPEP_0206133600 /NCGR_PEP_ID=MMETSP1472-20131121/54113_1 /ASSEMBLY_ACC=CAM_ASM_001108 /TAXON_ID=41880 /ORGANISM="Pycnococcus provasolii, Strain RCC251" /LENGTH=64 /DNA_ID=CAMNT_0053525175 /DNA_START=69 /DNA_END=263 /DNA_ORIENTATION=+